MKDQVPNVNFIYRIDGENIKKTTDDIFLNKKIVVFALPGAFTPTCSSQQLPGFVKIMIKLKNMELMIFFA